MRHLKIIKSYIVKLWEFPQKIKKISNRQKKIKKTKTSRVKRIRMNEFLIIRNRGSISNLFFKLVYLSFVLFKLL